MRCAAWIVIASLLACAPKPLVRRGADAAEPEDLGSGGTGGGGRGGGSGGRGGSGGMGGGSGMGGAGPPDAPPPREDRPPPDVVAAVDMPMPPDLAPDRPIRSALFVVGEVVLAPIDVVVRARMEAAGLAVVAIDDTASTTADAMGRALVFISSSVLSAQVLAKFVGVAVPTIVGESALFNDMAMTSGLPGSSGFALMQTQIAITNPTHALVAGLMPPAAAGPRTVYAAASGMHWATPGGAGTDAGTLGAVRVATIVGMPNQVTIFAYPSGSQMFGRTAPAKRVGLFVGHMDMMPTQTMLNADGQKLVDAAIAWALAP